MKKPSIQAFKRAIYGRPWAVRNETLAGLEQQAMGLPDDFDFDTLAPEPILNIDRGVAVITINGVLTKEQSVLDLLFGGTVSVMDVKAAIATALADKEVTAVIAKFDSPGGSTSMIPEVAEWIRVQRDASPKPLIAYCDQACSAGYWLASNFNHIVCDIGSEIGGIGIIAAFADPNRAMANQGLDLHTFRSADGKGAGMPQYNETHGRDLQSQVMTLFDLFKQSLALGRGWSQEETDKLAQPTVLIGQQALDAGLVDEIGTFDNLLAEYQQAESRV